MSKIIDISSHNTIEDFKKVAKDVDGCIIRMGYRGYGKAGNLVTDTSFEYNLNQCIVNNIPFGIYFFPTSVTTDEALEEAEFIIERVKTIYGKMSLPIFLDSEIAETKNKSGRSDKLTPHIRTSLLNTIIERLHRDGYIVGVYASRAWFNSNLIDSELGDCPHWVAEWSTKLTYSGKCSIWQYTSKGSINGIKGNVDISQITDDNIWLSTVALNRDLVPAKINIDIYTEDNIKITGWTLTI